MTESPVNGKLITIPSRLDRVDFLREEFGIFLRDCALGEEEIDTWKLVLSEVVVNAIVHGSGANPEKRVVVQWQARSGEVMLEVRDTGSGLPLDAEGMAVLPEDPLSANGRGLFLIRQFADEWEHWRGADGYRQVIVRKHAGLEPQQRDDSVLEQTVVELTQCYESLAAFYRLGEGLVRSETVGHFLKGAAEDLFKVVPCDEFLIVLGPFPQEVVLEDLRKLPFVSVQCPGGIVEEVFKSGDEFVWESTEEVKEDTLLQPCSCGFAGSIQAAGTFVGVLVLGRKNHRQYLQARDLNTLRTFCDLLGIAIANASNLVVRTREQRALRELEIASELQQTLLPIPSGKKTDRWQLTAQRLSARDISGDYLEMWEMPDGRLLLVVVDVMGKGVPAAFLACMLRTALHLSMEFHYELRQLMEDLNTVLYDQVGAASVFATCCMARIQPDLSSMEVVNAGHCPLILQRAETGGVLTVEPSGTPLGIFKDTRYQMVKQDLFPGDRIILFTDGLYEWESGDGIWGWEKWVDLVQQYRERPAEELWAGLQSLMMESRAGEPRQDDETFMCFDILP